MDFSSLPYELQFSYLIGLPYRDITSYCTSSPAAAVICIADEFWKYKVDHDYGLNEHKPENITYRQQYIDLMKGPSLEEAVQQGRIDLVLLNIDKMNFPRAIHAQLAETSGHPEIRDYLISMGVIYFSDRPFLTSKSLDDVRFTIEQLPEGNYSMYQLMLVFKLYISAIRTMLSRYMAPEDYLGIDIHKRIVLTRPGPRITLAKADLPLAIRSLDCFKVFTEVKEEIQNGKILNYQITKDQSGVAQGLTRVTLQLINGEKCETILRLIPETNRIFPPW